MKLSLFAAVTVCSAFYPAFSQTPTWINPSDAQYTRAIDDGYARIKLPKNQAYHVLEEWNIQPAINAHISVTPPLACALSMGKVAHDKLDTKPSLAEAKSLCDGRLDVMIVHYSQLLNKNWPCILQSGEFTLRPSLKIPDALPDVQTYYGGFLVGNLVGYVYVDDYIFNVTPALSQTADLIYSDDSGTHRILHLNFQTIAKDIQTHL
jgi:hypothetical protein